MCKHHANVQFCPLYVAAHDARGLGCISDLREACDVDRGRMDYAEAVKAVIAVDSDLVLYCYGREALVLAREQRVRNMLAAAVR